MSVQKKKSIEKKHLQNCNKNYEAIVLGVSAGGMDALKIFLSEIPSDFSIPIIIVQHRHIESDNYLITYLDGKCLLTVKEANEKEKIEPGFVYIAASGYHLMIEENKTFSLSVSELVNYSRPSIDVLFETAADAYGPRLIGIILTGANNDGSQGMKKIKRHGGLIIVQNPKTAEVDMMPKSVLAITDVDYVKDLKDIVPLLVKLTCSGA